MHNFGKSEHSVNMAKNARFQITSVANAYGQVMDRWYDGETKTLFAKKGKIVNVNIPEVKEYRYINFNCTQASSF